MTSWCLAGQRLSTAVRVAVLPTSRQSAFARLYPSVVAPYTRSLTVSRSVPLARALSGDATLKSRQKSSPKKAAHDTFYAHDSITFESLRTTPAVADALQHGGFSRPSTVQVCCISAQIRLFTICGSGTISNHCMSHRSWPCLC